MSKYVFMIYFDRPTHENIGSHYPDMIKKIMFIPERVIQKTHIENKKNGERFFFEDGRLFTLGEPILCSHASNESEARQTALELIEAWFGMIKDKIKKNKSYTEVTLN